MYLNHLQSHMVEYCISTTYRHTWLSTVFQPSTVTHGHAGIVFQSPTVTYGQVLYLDHQLSHMVRYRISSNHHNYTVSHSQVLCHHYSHAVGQSLSLCYEYQQIKLQASRWRDSRSWQWWSNRLTSRNNPPQQLQLDGLTFRHKQTKRWPHLQSACTQHNCLCVEKVVFTILSRPPLRHLQSACTDIYA